MSITSFILNNNKTIIKCSKDDYMKDICTQFLRKINSKVDEMIFIYENNIINQQLTFNEQIKEEDKKKNEITILCIEVNDIIKYLNQKEEKKNSEKEKKLKTNNVMCPECEEIYKMKLNDYKIALECPNGHNKDNLTFEQYEKMKNNEKLNIICNICNSYKDINEIMFNCLTCNNNICMSCSKNHNKEHHIIKYEMKHYLCNIHKKKYNSYCNKCKQNLCIICEKEHQKEKDLVFFKDMMPLIDDKKNREIKMKIESFTNNIKGLIKMLNRIIDTISIFYKIYYDIIDNFDKNDLNYQKLNNINQM